MCTRPAVPWLATYDAGCLDPASHCARLLGVDQLEELRLLTNADMDSHSPFACLLVGQPTLRRRIKLGTFAALDQRIALRYAMTGMQAAETKTYLAQRQHPLNVFGWSVEWGGWCCSGEGDRRTDEELSDRLGRALESPSCNGYRPRSPSVIISRFLL